MARLARVLSIGAPHHVTQRGNARQPVFERDEDRLVYLDLLRVNCGLQRLSVLGYCLMSNHVHLIAVPQRPESLPLALKHTHGRYAAYFNARRAACGHLWQGRYYSCPLDRPRLWSALRYTEMNPVRAGMAADPADYPWSSAAAHCGTGTPPSWLDMEQFAAAWNPSLWRGFLREADGVDEIDMIRRNTHTGRPLGSPEFVAAMEALLGRRLSPGRGGRPPKKGAEERPRQLSAGAGG